MVAQSVDSPTEEVASHHVFDGDFHLQVPLEKLQPYIEDEQIAAKVDEFGYPPKPNPALNGGYASGNSQRTAGSAGATTHGVALTTEDVTDVMAEMGTDTVLMTPPPDGPFGSGRYPVIMAELVRAYNDYLLDRVIDPEAGVYGSIMFPRWDVDAAVAEVERVGTADGILSVSDWIAFNEPFGSSRYDPLYDVLTDHGLPLLLHSGGEWPQRRDPLAEHFETLTEQLLAGFAYPTIGNVINMIMTGVFDKYPDLNLLVQEAGVNWIPLVAYRADELYQVYGQDVDMVTRVHELGQETIQRMPSEYLFDNVYVTTQPIAMPKNARITAAQLDVCHAQEMFVFSTDWPHGSVDSPAWVVEHRGIDEDVQSAIYHENAEDLFGRPFADP